MSELSTQCSIQKLSSGEQNYHNFKNESNDSLGKPQQHKDISLVGEDIEIDQSKIWKDTISHNDLVLKPLSQRQAETSRFNKTIDEIEKVENTTYVGMKNVKKIQRFALIPDEYGENLDTVEHGNHVNSKETKYIPGVDDDGNVCSCCFYFW